jgi:hypothetical protein
MSPNTVDSESGIYPLRGFDSEFIQESRAMPERPESGSMSTLNETIESPLTTIPNDQFKVKFRGKGD